MHVCGRVGWVAFALVVVSLSACTVEPAGHTPGDMESLECEIVHVTWTIPDGSISETPWVGLSNQEVIDAYFESYADQREASEDGCQLPASVLAEIAPYEAEARQDAIAASAWQDRLLPDMAGDIGVEIAPDAEGFGIADDDWTTWSISMRSEDCLDDWSRDHLISLGVEGVGRWGMTNLDSGWVWLEAQGPPAGIVWAFILSDDEIVHEIALGPAAISDGNRELYVIAEPCSEGRLIRTVESASDLPSL